MQKNLTYFFLSVTFFLIIPFAFLQLLQLCHYIQESQDHGLAKELLSVRPTLELRNIWLSPNDIDALAFVVNSGGNNDIGLDFGACSMELECLDVLSRCQYIHHLRWVEKHPLDIESCTQYFHGCISMEICCSTHELQLLLHSTWT